MNPLWNCLCPYHCLQAGVCSCAGRLQCAAALWERLLPQSFGLPKLVPPCIGHAIHSGCAPPQMINLAHFKPSEATQTMQAGPTNPMQPA